MKVSLMKKGSQALALTLLSVCLSLGTSGLASAHNVSDASLAKGPKHSAEQVWVSPGTVKLTSYGTAGFGLYVHHLAPMTTYTLSSADLGNPNLCPVSPALGSLTTDLEGNYSGYFTLGIAGNTAVTSSLVAALTAANLPFSAANAITVLNDVNNAIAANGGTNASLTAALTAAATYVATPNAANAAAASLAVNNALAANIVTASPCVPNTYHISVQQPAIHQVLTTWFRVKA